MLARSLLRYRCVSMAGVPASDRVKALQAQLLAWQPFPESLYLVDLLGDQAQVFALDQQQLAPLENSNAPLWPESLLHEAPADGVVLLECLEGFEGQAWRGAVLNTSRWWPQLPDEAEWLGFVRQCRLSPAESQAALAQVPVARSSPWFRPARQVLRADQLSRSQQGNERLVLGAAGLILVAATAYGAHDAWATYQFRLAQQAAVMSLKDEVAPILAAREKALAAADQSAALVGLLRAAAPLEVMEHLGRLLPKGSTVKELDIGPQTVRVALELPAEVSRAKVVAELESGGWFVQVSEVKDSVSRAWINLEMRLSGPQPPGPKNADAALTRTSNQKPEPPPGLDATAPARVPGPPSGTKP
nr:hypothetical protein [uncultured Roseateles sp.]